jgi:tryptophanyl-tRNA synthetase
MYQAFASLEETAAMQRAYAEGIAWGDAKAMLFERIDRDVAPMREQYHALVANPEKIEAILQAGAARATALSGPFMQELRHAVGLRKLQANTAPASKTKAGKAVGPSFKQYREADGQFYFKLLSAEGKLLMQSRGFVSPKEAAQAIASLQQQGADALPALQGQLDLMPGVEMLEVAAALSLPISASKDESHAISG